MIGFPPSATICLSTANERRFSWFFCGCCSFSYILLLFFSIFYCFPSVCVWLYHLSNCLPQSKLCDDYFIHLTVWTVQLFSNSNSHPLKTIIILFYFFYAISPEFFRIAPNCSRGESQQKMLWKCTGAALKLHWKSPAGDRVCSRPVRRYDLCFPSPGSEKLSRGK